MVRRRVLAALSLLVAGSFWIGPHAHAATITISDQTFANANWSLSQFNFGGGTVTAGQISQGANLLRSIQDAVAPGTPSHLLGAHIFTAETFTPAVSGPILSIDYFEDAICLAGCFGDGQASGLALIQGGSVYVTNSFLLTGPSNTLHPLSDTGLTAADLALVSLSASGFFDNTQHPDFSGGGAPIQFGFVRANSTAGGGYTLTAGIDNWRVVITTPNGIVPAPSTLLLIGLGLAGLAITRRRHL